MAVLAVSGWFLYNSPSGFLFAILLGVMMRVGIPNLTTLRRSILKDNDRRFNAADFCSVFRAVSDSD